MAEGRYTNPVTATLAGIKDFFSRQELASRNPETGRADGLTILISGTRVIVRYNIRPSGSA
jgi:hypothetical protein